MIRVYLQGRIGNQLFQFAFAKLLAKQLRTRVLLDMTDEPFGLVYFNLPGYWSILEYKFFARIYNRVQGFLMKRGEEIDVRDCFKELLFSQFVDDKNYRGYFQDYRIFQGHELNLQKWFGIKKKYRKVFEENFLPKLNKKKSIVVHFRLGDYKSFKPFFVNEQPPIVPIDWYYKVLSCFDKTVYNVYCISDDIKAVSKQFRPQGYNIQYVEADVATDFLLLNHADVCIISNSTFAWWGAFLNKKAEIIICPEYFLGLNHGKEYPPHIYPPHWRKVSTILN